MTLSTNKAQPNERLVIAKSSSAVQANKVQQLSQADEEWQQVDLTESDLRQVEQLTEAQTSNWRSNLKTVGGFAGAAIAVYYTAVVIPSIAAEAAKTAVTAAISSTLGPTLGGLAVFDRIGTVAGGEAYKAITNTGYFGPYPTTAIAAATVGYTVGSTAVEYTISGVEKVYDAATKLVGLFKPSSWAQRVTQERNHQAVSARL